MQTDDPRAIASRLAAHLRRPWHRDYARRKVYMDPAYAAVAALLREDQTGVLDIGCGLGLLGYYLRESGFSGRYLGVDLDSAKIIEAQRVARTHYPDLAFEDGNATELPSFSGHVVLLDVLHYLDRTDQQALLSEAAARVAPGAALIIRNVLREPTWRFRITVLEERIIHAIGWMGSPPRHFPEREEIEAPLRAAEMTIDTRPLWGNTPFNSFMIVARRAGPQGNPA